MSNEINRDHPLGFPVGGQSHGGSVSAKVGAWGASKCVTPYGLDCSDYDGGNGEHVGRGMNMAASGKAGGYPASTSRGNSGKRGNMSDGY